jgi:hypothetical protein
MTVDYILTFSSELIHKIIWSIVHDLSARIKKSYTLHPWIPTLS